MVQLISRLMVFAFLLVAQSEQVFAQSLITIPQWMSRHNRLIGEIEDLGGKKGPHPKVSQDIKSQGYLLSQIKAEMALQASQAGDEQKQALHLAINQYNSFLLSPQITDLSLLTPFEVVEQLQVSDSQGGLSAQESQRIKALFAMVAGYAYDPTTRKFYQSIAQSKDPFQNIFQARVLVFYAQNRIPHFSLKDYQTIRSELHQRAFIGIADRKCAVGLGTNEGRSRFYTRVPMITNELQLRAFLAVAGWESDEDLNRANETLVISSVTNEFQVSALELIGASFCSSRPVEARTDLGPFFRMIQAIDGLEVARSDEGYVILGGVIRPKNPLIFFEGKGLFEKMEPLHGDQRMLIDEMGIRLSIQTALKVQDDDYLKAFTRKVIEGRMSTLDYEREFAKIETERAEILAAEKQPKFSFIIFDSMDQETLKQIKIQAVTAANNGTAIFVNANQVFGDFELVTWNSEKSQLHLGGQGDTFFGLERYEPLLISNLILLHQYAFQQAETPTKDPEIVDYVKQLKARTLLMLRDLRDPELYGLVSEVLESEPKLANLGEILQAYLDEEEEDLLAFEMHSADLMGKTEEFRDQWLLFVELFTKEFLLQTNHRGLTSVDAERIVNYFAKPKDLGPYVGIQKRLFEIRLKESRDSLKKILEMAEANHVKNVVFNVSPNHVGPDKTGLQNVFPRISKVYGADQAAEALELLKGIAGEAVTEKPENKDQLIPQEIRDVIMEKISETILLVRRAIFGW